MAVMVDVAVAVNVLVGVDVDVAVDVFVGGDVADAVLVGVLVAVGRPGTVICRLAVVGWLMFDAWAVAE